MVQKQKQDREKERQSELRERKKGKVGGGGNKEERKEKTWFNVQLIHEKQFTVFYGIIVDEQQGKNLKQ